MTCIDRILWFIWFASEAWKGILGASTFSTSYSVLYTTNKLLLNLKCMIMINYKIKYS